MPCRGWSPLECFQPRCLQLSLPSSEPPEYSRLWPKTDSSVSGSTYKYIRMYVSNEWVSFYGAFVTRTHSASSLMRQCVKGIENEIIKGTEAQTLGALRIRGTANWWAGLWICSWSPASSSYRVWHGLATVVDSRCESIHALRCDFLNVQGSQSERIRSR